MVPTVELPLATPSTFQVTPVLVEPETLAVMARVPPARTVAVAGDWDRATGVGAGAGAVTVMLLEAKGGGRGGAGGGHGVGAGGDRRGVDRAAAGTGDRAHGASCRP